MTDDSSAIPLPPHGWTCFFCGDTFMTPGAARDHFGGDMGSTAACRIKAGAEKGSLMELRRVEEELARYRNDDCDLARDIHRIQARHSQALQNAEELGYERGLRDGRREWMASQFRINADGSYVRNLRNVSGPYTDNDDSNQLR